MSAAGLNDFFDRSRLKIAVPVLVLALAAGPGFFEGTARAERAVQPEAAAQTELSLFRALDQWMDQNEASYKYDLGNLKDPFKPIKYGNVDPEPIFSAFTQLKLVAIIMFDNNIKAMASFEDGAGSAYILREGDRVGPEKVIKISKSTVTIEDSRREAGDPARIREMKLPEPGILVAGSSSDEALQIQRGDSEQ